VKQLKELHTSLRVSTFNSFGNPPPCVAKTKCWRSMQHAARLVYTIETHALISPSPHCMHWEQVDTMTPKSIFIHPCTMQVDRRMAFRTYITRFKDPVQLSENVDENPFIRFRSNKYIERNEFRHSSFAPVRRATNYAGCFNAPNWRCKEHNLIDVHLPLST
jgi:hypothetical protein